jgi:GNAT superfamily N-acetyltransferase
MQVGPRDRLPKLTWQFALAPDPTVWAITCLLLVPPYRHKGLAHRFLGAVLADLRERGIRRVEAYPRVGDGLDDGDVWNGPEALYLSAGFVLQQEVERRRVYAKELA